MSTLMRNFQAAVKFAVEKGFKVTFATTYSRELKGRDDSTWTLAAWPYRRCLALTPENGETTQHTSITSIKTAISHAAEVCDYLAADENNEG